MLFEVSLNTIINMKTQIRLKKLLPLPDPLITFLDTCFHSFPKTASRKAWLRNCATGCALHGKKRLVWVLDFYLFIYLFIYLLILL